MIHKQRQLLDVWTGMVQGVQPQSWEFPVRWHCWCSCQQHKAAAALACNAGCCCAVVGADLTAAVCELWVKGMTGSY